MTNLDPDAIQEIVDNLRSVIEKRGIRSILLIDDAGKPYLVPWGDQERAEVAEVDGIVRAQTYSLTLTCGPCKTSGPHAGKKKCCEQIGGDYLCRWVAC